MTPWCIAALLYASSLAQQSQGLVNQSPLPPPGSVPSAAASKERPEVKAPAAAAPETPKPAPVKKTEADAKPVEPLPPAPVSPTGQEKKEPAAGARVAAFWFILPGK